MVMFQEERRYQAFYTRSTPIVDYMVGSLLLEPGDKIFDPCGGDGVFIEAILEKNTFATIDVCELNMDSIRILNEKFFPYKNIHIRQCDTLMDSDLIFNSGFGGMYDKIIANPPYGAWQDYGKREKLKKLFPNLYTRETYTLFLYRCIELLKPGGILSFIIPDTFLNLHMHKAIRQHILTRTKIKELVLFPSSFFPGVNFGYANLSIITLQKCQDHTECLNNSFRIVSNFKNVEQLSNTGDDRLSIRVYTQEDIFANADHAFLMAENSDVIDIINKSELKIGDIANCVTGFYSGDDKRFLHVIRPDLKNGKNYNLVPPGLINRDYHKFPDILGGIDGGDYFLPIVKGGNTKYLKPDDWYMNWSRAAVNHYKTDKKARFQNPQYYFKFGIGVPMISSSSITASLIENKLFDQSIVGIFPEDESLVYYLLGFFNSPTCNLLIRTINPSANNPANYIKKIPFIMPDKKVLRQVTDWVREIVDSIKSTNNYDLEIEQKIYSDIRNLYRF